MRIALVTALLVATAAVNVACSRHQVQPDGIESRRGAATNVECPSGTPLAVSVGSGYACKLLPDHTVECWGENGYGQLGDGSTATAAVPVPVTGLTGVTAVSTGRYRSCAVLS